MSKYKSKPIIMLAASMLFAVFAQAQESVNSSGGNTKGSGGTSAYSVGQLFYTTNMGTLGSAAQGVQHAYEILTVGTKETELEISLSAYPNPTGDRLTLQIIGYNNEKLSYQLLDLQGKFIGSGQVISNQTQIEMHNLPSATYYLNVVDGGNKKVQAFKIIRN